MKINKFLEFKQNKLELIVESILNESIVYYSPKLRNILKRVKDDISIELLNAEKTDIKDDITFIDLDETKPGYITFTKMNKAKEKLIKDSDFAYLASRLDNLSDNPIMPSNLDYIYNQDLGNIYSKDRISVRLSRVVNKLSSTQYSPDKIDTFTRKVMAKLTKEGYKFKLVNEYEIGFWYNQSNYAEISGSLGNSCMREKSESFFNLYNDNKDVCSMLILLDEENKLIGRALVWKLNLHHHTKAPKELYFMDRQYVIDETDVERFRQYADEQGWAYKTKNSHSSLYDVTYKGVNQSIAMEVQIEGGNYKNYPYMDTFKKYDPDTGILYNNDSEEDSGGLYILNSTTGDYTEISEEEEGIYSEYEDRTIDEDYAVWSDAVQSYLHVDNAIEIRSGSRRYLGWYPDGHEDLVHDEWIDEYIHMDDAIYSDYYDYYILIENFCQGVVSVDSDGEPKLNDIVCRDRSFYEDDEYNETIWFKKISEEFDDWRYSTRLLNSITYIDVHGDICLKEFKIKVKKVKNHSEKAIELGFNNVTYLSENDYSILECEMEEFSMDYDIFRYYKNLEELLPTYYKFIKEKEEIILDLIKNLEQENKIEELTNARKLLSIINLVIDNIESNNYVEVELE
jgi:6-pyruvoyl-tetrahydropterin synthase